MKKKIWAAIIIVFPVSVIFSMSVGRYPLGLADIGKCVADRIGFGSFGDAVPVEAQLIFWNIRLPRNIMSCVVGGGISVAGVVFQALFRNPLAAPDILGVTAGSCFGAALAILFFTQFFLGVQGFAFVFGAFAVSLAYLLASRSWERSAAVLVISGIVVSAVFQAGLSILMYIANPYDQLAKIVFWIMGSFHVASWKMVTSTVPIVFFGALLLCVFSWRLNIMCQSEEEALSLGVDVFRWRLFYVAVSTLVVAASVAAVGTIAWVGLIMPHIARFLVGTEHKRLVPAAALLGGSFMLIMDTVARTAMASEIPISIVTSIFGAPFLGYLVLSRRRIGIANESSY